MNTGWLISLNELQDEVICAVSRRQEDTNNGPRQFLILICQMIHWLRLERERDLQIRVLNSYVVIPELEHHYRFWSWLEAWMLFSS